MSDKVTSKWSGAESVRSGTESEAEAGTKGYKNYGLEGEIEVPRIPAAAKYAITRGTGGVYKCPFEDCGRAFDRNTRATACLNTHLKPFCCPKNACEQTFESKKSTLRHVIQAHKAWLVEQGHAPINMICEVCNKVLTRGDNLARHKKNQHPTTPKGLKKLLPASNISHATKNKWHISPNVPEDEIPEYTGIDYLGNSEDLASMSARVYSINESVKNSRKTWPEYKDEVDVLQKEVDEFNKKQAPHIGNQKAITVLQAPKVSDGSPPRTSSVLGMVTLKLDISDLNPEEMVALGTLAKAAKRQKKG